MSTQRTVTVHMIGRTVGDRRGLADALALHRSPLSAALTRGMKR